MADKLNTKLSNFRMLPTSSTVAAMSIIDENGQGITLVVDEVRLLLGVVTGGELRW